MAPYALFRQLWPAALCLVEVARAADGYIHLPFSRPQQQDLTLGTLGSRRLSDFIVPYLVKAQVGTPPQDISLLISPTSTDTWVPNAITEICNNDYFVPSSDSFDDDTISIYVGVEKCVWGSYNESASSTFRTANSRYTDFDAFTFYGTARGTNFTDKLVIGDFTFDNYPMGLVDRASPSMGVLGLGYNYSETMNYYSYYYQNAGVYPTILDRMVSSGQIATPAYSIWLDNDEGSSGSLLFGAVIKSWYEGDLIRLSATNPHAVAGKLSVSVHSINTTRLDGPDGGMQSSLISNDLPVDVTIGMGELVSFLPDDLVSSIASVVGATQATTTSPYTIPCDAGTFSNTSLIAFRLGGEGGPLLEAATADLIINPGVFNGQVSPDDETYYDDGDTIVDLPNGTCVFGIQTWDSMGVRLGSAGIGSSYSSSPNDVYYNLGNSLLRRSYFVFDLARQELAVAPVAWSKTSTTRRAIDSTSDGNNNIIPFSEYGAAIPESEYFCSDYESYCPDYSINDGSGGLTPSDNDDDYYHYGRANWKTISIVLGVIFGTLILVGLVVAGVLWKRVISKDRRTMGLQSDEKKRLMDGEEGQSGGDDVAQQQMMMTPAGGAGTAPVPVGPATSGGPPGLLPIIREGREDDTESYLPPRENEASGAASVDAHANHREQQRLSAPDTNLMDAPTPRSPSPLSEDGMGVTRAEAASPVSERLGTPPNDPKGKGKGKALVENIGQAH